MSVSREFVEELIALQLRPGATLTAFAVPEPQADEPVLDACFRETIRESGRILGKQVLVYFAAESDPEHFCLNFGDVLAVVFSERFVALASALNLILSNPNKDKTQPIPLVNQVLLKVSAEFLLHAGKPDDACRAFIRSLVGQPAHVMLADAKYYKTLDGGTLESFVVGWCAGLAHELGHFWTETKPSWQQDAATLLATLPELYHPQHLAFLGDVAPIGPLDSAHVEEELKADEFSLQVIEAVARQLCPRYTGEALHLPALALEHCANLLHVDALSRCRKAVHFLTERKRESLRDCVLLPAVLSLRLRVCSRLWLEKIRTSLDDPAETERLSRVYVTLLDHQSTTVNEGFWQAFSILADSERHLKQLASLEGELPVSDPGERNYYTLLRYAIAVGDLHAEPGKPGYLRWAANEFAEAGLKQQPGAQEYQCLKEILQDPEKRIRNFIVPTWVSENGHSQAVALPTSVGHLVTVFSSEEPYLAPFEAWCRTTLKPGATIQRTLMLCREGNESKLVPLITELTGITGSPVYLKYQEDREFPGLMAQLLAQKK